MIVRDTVQRGDELVEDTFDWYAQDAAGNIWYLGEDTAEFEGGAGHVDRRLLRGRGGRRPTPDVIMPAEPEGWRCAIGRSTYAGEAEDNGEILSTDEQAEVPFGHFDRRHPHEGHDHDPSPTSSSTSSMHATSVLVLVLGVSGGGGREELIGVETVDGEAARLAGTTPLGEPYP